MDLVADQFVTVHQGSGAPEVTVLVPLYRQARYVGEAVRSVLAQTGIVAEVIISDDASADETLDVARHAVDEVVAAGPLPHRVVVRAGGSRLRRDHLHLLAAHAACDVVVQAHGDDISVPTRVRRPVDAVEATGAAMAASAIVDVDEHGSTIATHAPADDAGVRLLTPQEAFARSSWLVGASTAWRRSAFAPFEPLTQATTPSMHDFVMVRRALAVGGVAVVPTPLLRRRIHPGNWSGRLVDAERSEAETFGWCIQHLGVARTVSADLDRLEQLGLGDRDLVDRLRALTLDWRERVLGRMIDAHAALAAEGLQPRWVTDDEVQHDLGAVLARWARRRGAVQHGLDRVLTHRRRRRIHRA